MIASKSVRLFSLAIVALAAVLGVRVVLGGFAFGGDLLNTRASGFGAGEGGQRTDGVVAYVLDGDTVQVDLTDGQDVLVRVLGISAPEIPHPGKPGECYGGDATRNLEKLLPVGSEVTLVRDPTQDDVDTYDRWLRYVEASGRDVGAAQIRSGAAEARSSANPVSRHPKYTRLEERARQNHRGLWSAAAGCR